MENQEMIYLDNSWKKNNVFEEVILNNCILVRINQPGNLKS